MKAYGAISANETFKNKTPSCIFLGNVSTI